LRWRTGAQLADQPAAQNFALAKPAMPIFGKRRMVWDLAVEAQAAKPAIGDIEMHFFAQAAF
jgi:hypothetical protein